MPIATHIATDLLCCGCYGCVPVFCDYRCNILHSCTQILISYICISPPSPHNHSPSSPDPHLSLPATSLPANSPPTSHSAPSSSVTAVSVSSTLPHQQPPPQPRQQPTRKQPARRRATQRRATQRHSPASSSESSDSEPEPAARLDRRTDALPVEHLCHVPPVHDYQRQLPPFAPRRPAGFYPPQPYPTTAVGFFKLFFTDNMLEIIRTYVFDVFSLHLSSWYNIV